MEKNKKSKFERFDDAVRKVSKYVYPALALAGVIYIASKAGTKSALEQDRAEFYAKQDKPRPNSDIDEAFVFHVGPKETDVIIGLPSQTVEAMTTGPVRVPSDVGDFEIKFLLNKN